MIPNYELNIKKIKINTLMSVMELKDEEVLDVVSILFQIKIVLFIFIQPLIEPKIVSFFD